VAGVVAAVVGAGVAAPVSWSLAQADGPASNAGVTAADGAGSGDEAGRSVADIASEFGPSVARVSVSGPQGEGSGSAVIYRSDGYLVTNAHVVAAGGEITVTLPDGTTQPAEVAGADTVSDLAVLRVEAEDLPVPAHAEAPPAVGDTAIAIGSPFGLDGSVTSGIVSALGRSVATPGSPLVDMIQTDAAINPGNSGGALVDDAGRLVGINTAILSRTGASNGIGFAIPVATVRSVADQLIETGHVDHAYLGVQGVTLDAAVAERYGVDADAGAVIVGVEPSGPAAQAGLQPGDTVVAVDDEAIASMEDLTARIQRADVGSTIAVTVLRDGDRQTVETTLAERPTD
jgi:S1-C subfamily serine protease